jgi:hypothetical protein
MRSLFAALVLALLFGTARADTIASDQTYHVSVTGNDANDCLSESNGASGTERRRRPPFATR